MIFFFAVRCAHCHADAATPALAHAAFRQFQLISLRLLEAAADITLFIDAAARYFR